MRQAVAIRAVAHEVFPAAGPFVPDARQLRHYRDLLGPFGVPFDPAMLQRGARTGFHAMSEAVVGRLAAGDVDLVVLAHATPDCEPTRSAASHLAFICAGEPRAFALSDLGVGAPFAALRVIAAHLESPGFDCALLVVLEQTSLPNYDERVHDSVLDSAVAIALGARGEVTVAGVSSRADVAPADAGRVALELLAAEPEETLLVVGPAIALDGNRIHRAAAQHHCSAVWIELSLHLERWRERHERVLVADYDSRLRQLHAARIDMAAKR